MLLTLRQSYNLLEKHGVFAREICDKCGVVLGASRFTRKDEPGVWCSRECRGESERPAIHRGGRPHKYANGAEKQKAYRERILRVTKPSRSFAETKDLQAQKPPLSHYPLTSPFSPLETVCNENGGASV